MTGGLHARWKEEGVYVDPTAGDDVLGDGSRCRPLKTYRKAQAMMGAVIDQPTTVLFVPDSKGART